MIPGLKIFQFKKLFRSILKIASRITKAITLVTSLMAVLLVVYKFGYTIPEIVHLDIDRAFRSILFMYLVFGLLRFVFNFRDLRKEKGFWFEVLLGILFLLTAISILNLHTPDFIKVHPVWYKTEQMLTYILVLFLSITQLSKEFFYLLHSRIKPEMLFAYSFLVIVFIGAFLLKLPNATHSGISFINALFTSTSAVCVTGLTVVPTSSTFTIMGQSVILLLIQIGGIGVMTFTSFFAMSFLSKTSFRDQLALKDLLNESSLNNIFRTLLYTILTTFVVESVGIYMVYLQINDVEAIQDKFFFSLFHAVSAFCNAGFSTLPDNLFTPAVRHLYGLQTWLAILIVIGGLGFPIVFNYINLFHFSVKRFLARLFGKDKRYVHPARIVSITTRIVFPMTILLLAGGTALFWILENDNTLKGLPLVGKLATSFMGAVTPRTAGFNNVELTAMLPSTVFLTLVLMWIGASPMSTGGGIKTTTFAVALMNIYGSIRGKRQVETAMRQLPFENINRSYAIIGLSILWIGGATISILILEPQASLTQAIFETTSALSTVGLTLDLTPTLSDAGKIVVSLTMFVGRVGLYVLLAGIIKQKSSQNYTYPDETVIL